MRTGHGSVGSGHRLAARFHALNPARDQTTSHQPVEAEAEILTASQSKKDLVVLASDIAAGPELAKPVVGPKAQSILVWASRALGRLVSRRSKPVPTTS